MNDTTQFRKDPKFIASAVLVGLIVLAGIILVGLNMFGGTDNGTSEPIDPTTAPSRGTASSSACGLTDGSQEIPLTAPSTNWYFKGKVAVPSSPAFGPGEGAADAEIATCFAHSPTGALFAAATIAAETSSFSSVAVEAIQTHVVAGELRDELIKTLDPNPGALAQIVGFKFEDHTQDRTTLTLATRIVDGPNAGAIGATPMTLVWRERDWRQELHPATTTVVITSLDGFVAWSGIS